MKRINLTIALIGFCLVAFAQSQDQHKKNLLKVNLTSPILKNYSIQYERILNKRLSLALSGRVMPATAMPFRNLIKDQLTEVEDENVNRVIDQLRFSNYAITPELRWYVGKKGYGRGFYIAPYYRFAVYEANGNNITVEEDGETYSADVTGKVTAHNGGLLFGAQWLLGKTIGLDLWLLGPSFGRGNGNVVGVSSTPLDADEQTELRSQLEKIDIPYTRETYHVDATGGRIDLTGPWAGVRAGLMLTFSF